ncbi:MAG: glycosyltransferase family 39 protein [Cyanobacteriota bacterium]|nr:glycosyltransferase family 39 protein [Cyanobacteriota bacterium]
MSNLLTLLLIWLLSGISDRLWFALDRSVPAWDQADYLTNSLNYWRIFQDPQWFSSQWWEQMWMLSPKVPPLTYILTVPFLNIFGIGQSQATWVHLLFNAILLASVYAIAIRLFNRQVAVWACIISVLLPGLYVYRLQYLIDYPVTVMVTLCFCCLTQWKFTQKKMGVGDCIRRIFWAGFISQTNGFIFPVYSSSLGQCRYY